MKKEVNLFYISISMLLAVLILYYSIAPSFPAEKKTGIKIDKIKHLAAYALLSLSLYMSGMLKKHAFLIAGTYGFFIEVIQLGTANHFFDIIDIMTNYLGSSVVFFLRSKNGKRIAGKL